MSPTASGSQLGLRYGLDLTPKFLEFENIGRGESDWGVCRFSRGREGSGNQIILVDLRTEVGSKKTIPDPVSFTTRSE